MRATLLEGTEGAGLIIPPLKLVISSELIISMGDSKKRGIFAFFNATRDQAKDIGMVIAVVCLVFAYYSNDIRAIPFVIIILIVNLVFCNIYKPIASVWLRIAHIIGTITSKIILSGVFILILIPMGIVRQIIGIDSLMLRQWKENDASVLKIREHLYGPSDVEKPY
jgi:hypothetical protein